MPIAQEEGNSAAKIATKKENIAISFDKKRYTYLRHKELAKCIRIRKMRICNNEAPWMDETIEPDCEALMLNQPSAANLKKCPITVRQNFKGYWTFLKPANAWLYSVPTQTRVVVNCREGIAEGTFIKGVGILKIKAGCSATQGRYLLRTSPALRKTLTESYRPKLTLNLLELGGEVIKKGTTIRKFSKFSSSDEIIDNSRIEEIQGEFERLSKILAEKESFSRENYGGMILAITSIITVAILTLETSYIVWKYRALWRNTHAPLSQEKRAETLALQDPLAK